MRKTKNLILSAVLAVAIGLSAPGCSQALSGLNIDDTRIDVYTEQGNDWFLARSDKTNNDGVLEEKDVLPGKYKMKVSSSDERENQYLAVRLQMLDSDGRKLTDNTNVELSIYLDGKKTYLMTLKTDGDGWLKVSGLSLDTEYYIDVLDGNQINKKSGETRIITNAEIDDSNWFQSLFKNTKNQVLEAKNVLPGEYKFETPKKSDRTFTLHAQMLNDKGRLAKNAQVKIYVYIKKAKTFVAEVKTSDDGWVTLPGVMTNTKYKLTVK